MAQVLGDIMAPIGKFIDRETNQEKTRWMKCGILLKTDNGMRLKLDGIPVGVGPDGLWMSVFEKDDQPPRRQAKTAPAPSQSAPAGDDDKQDNIPF